jgi:hypothetical protein
MSGGWFHSYEKIHFTCVPGLKTETDDGKGARGFFCISTSDKFYELITRKTNTYEKEVSVKDV